MAEADFDIKDFEERNVMSPKGLHVRFFMHPEKQEHESADAGRPIYKEVEYLEILSGGSTLNIVIRAVNDMDRERFRDQYRRFKDSGVDVPDGTLLREIPWMEASFVHELAHLRIRTVEQLAEVSDQVCTGMPGLFDLKRKAQLWLKKSEAAAPFTKLAEENADLRKRLDALESAQSQAANQPKKA